MTTTYENAVDEIFSTFLTYWNANIDTLNLGYTPNIEWRNVESDSYPDPSKHWLRVSQKTLHEGQTALKEINKRFDTQGIVIVELYFSKATLNNGQDRIMCNIARDAFRKASQSDVWYRNSRIVELDEEEDFFRANVTSEYTYTEVL